VAQYQLCFLKNDVSGMAQHAAWGARKPGIEDAMLALDAETAAYSGQLHRAEELTKQAVASALRADQKETAASYEAAAGVRQAFFGNHGAAKQHAEAALAMSNGRDVEYIAGVALAAAGDGARVEALLSDFAKRFPQDTLVRLIYVPTLRAQLELSRHDPAKAIAELQPAAPYELGQATTIGSTISTALYPVYVRALAYLEARRGNEALAEYQKIMGSRGVVINGPIGVLAQLGQGRTYSLAGDPAKAKIAYQDFLAAWKDADPDIPRLAEAKKEYASLH